MAADPQPREQRPSETTAIPQQTGLHLAPGLDEIAEGESGRIAMERARRLVAAELDIAETQRRLLESNLKITEAQLELAERQLDQLAAENQQLRQENQVLRDRLGEPP